MSMYNMLNGVNMAYLFVMPMLDLDETRIPRFRDCFAQDGKIVVYTRTGGGNRDFYDSPEHSHNFYGDDSDDYAGPWNSDLTSLPTYLYDEDDEFDSTYASFYFDVPLQWAADFHRLMDGKYAELSDEYWAMMAEHLDFLEGFDVDEFRARILSA